MDRGKIIAMDTPKNLIGMLGGGLIQVGLLREDEDLRGEVEKLSEVRSAFFLNKMLQENGSPEKAYLKIESRQHVNLALVQLIALFNDRNAQVLSLETLEPNLETVFLHLTGKSLRQ